MSCSTAQSRTLASLIVAVAVVSAAPRSGAAEGRSDAKAKAHYNQGVIEYNLRHFDNAVSEFEQAYRLSPQPVFLFNMAQAHRKAGHLDDAVYFYKRYLSVAPDAAERDEVKKRVAELEEVLAKQREVGNKPPESVSAPVPVPDEKAVRPTETPVATSTAAQPVAPVPTAPQPTAAALPAERPAARFDVAATAGLGVATSGAPAEHSAGPALALLAGYAHHLGRSLALRVGLIIGLFRISDTDSTLSLYTFAIEPGLRLGAPGARVSATLGLGVGMTAIGGLQASSSLLTGVSDVQGTQLALAVRPSAGLALALTKHIDLRASAAFCYSPKPDESFVHSSATRLEILVGLGARF